MACNEDGCSLEAAPMAGMQDPRQELIESVVRKVVAELTFGAAAAGSGQWAEGWWILEQAARALIRTGASRVGACASSGCATRLAPDLAGNIDHTLLKPDATPEAIEKLCREALQYKFASVCINPCYVEYGARYLSGSGVDVCTVVGFPLGACTSAAKAFETQDAIRRGATEIDMVINVGWLKGGLYPQVLEDIREVVRAAGGACTKVIIEAALLTDDEKVAACALTREAGADFVKTSTGFASGGATVEDVALMRRVVGPSMGVKAAGGIRDTATAEAMLRAGANRIGASASVKIIGAGK